MSLLRKIRRKNKNRMIKIVFPEPIVETKNEDGSIKEGGTDAASLIRDAVLTLPFWKEGADLKRIDALLEIEDALDVSSQEPLISIDSRNLLKEAMQMRLPNGQYAGLANQRQNRFYMKMFRAVVVAKDAV